MVPESIPTCCTSKIISEKEFLSPKCIPLKDLRDPFKITTKFQVEKVRKNKEVEEEKQMPESPGSVSDLELSKTPSTK